MAALSPEAARALLRVLDQDIPALARALKNEPDPEMRRYLEAHTEQLLALRHRLIVTRGDRSM